MPLYEYKCRECNHEDDEFQRMADAPLNVCPKCHQQSYCKQVSLPHTDLKEFHTPIEMFSIALDTREEVEDFARRCPDVDIETDEDHPMFGVPIARSRKAKMQALSASGFTETNSERVH